VTVSVPSSRRGKASQSTSSQQPQTVSTADSFITIGLNNVWLKLEKYYAYTDRLIVYVAGVVLNSYKK
jgi:hypothetical protein